MNAMLQADPGFATEKIFTFSLNPPYPQSARRHQYYERILSDLRSTPGVQAAAAANWLPPDDPFKSKFFFHLEVPDLDQLPQLSTYRIVTEDYFAAMGIAIKTGREYKASDRSASSLVVNEAFTRLFWPDFARSLGRRVKSPLNPNWMTIIGVVRNVKNNGLDQSAGPCAYLLLSDQSVPEYMSIAVHSALNSQTLLRSARSAVTRADPGLALFDVQSIEKRLRRPLWLQRASLWLLGLFSLVSLTLAVAGVYAIVLYTTSQRTRELAIRMALGADKRQIVMAVLREGMQLVIPGFAMGFAGIWLSIRQVVALDDKLVTFDPLTCLTVMAVLLSAALLATLWPALRVASLRPTTALGAE